MTKKTTSKVYSYIRFSTPEQALGDSERRQLEAAKAYAERQGYPFDESLRMIDEGKSAYRGTHRKKGVLGEFLKKVESGQIPVGSILVVENVDRLSREGFLDAFEVIRQIIKNGIDIHTLSPEAAYDKKT